MAATVHETNRPVHLARRDAFVERAVELLYQPFEHVDTPARIEQVGRVLSLLDTALRHAERAARSERAIEEERDFGRFLRLLLQNVQSVHALMQNQAHLESEGRCFLSQFLGVSDEDATLSAANYRRRAEDMLMGLWQMLRLSHAPYRGLQARDLEGLTAEERERYHRAYASFREEVSEKYPLRTAPAAEAAPLAAD